MIFELNRKVYFLSQTGLTFLELLKDFAADTYFRTFNLI